MRCPHCGNDNPPEEYVCTFCGTRLQMEPIEKFKVFRRVEEKWSETKEEKRIFKQLIMIIRNPSRAFWMITKNPKKGGVWVIILLNAVLFGLMASAIVWRTQISQFGAVQMNFNTYYLRWIMDLKYGSVSLYLDSFTIYSSLWYGHTSSVWQQTLPLD